MSLGWMAQVPGAARPRRSVGPACFLEGTRIETAAGRTPVEKLAAGDAVTTLMAGASAVVRRVAVREVDCRRHPRPAMVWPIRVAAHAFGPCEPMRTLLVSPGHAVYLNGALVPILALVNGRTILQVRMDQVRYYHVELERRDAVLTEGLAMESHYAPDAGGRVVPLFPDFTTRWQDAESGWDEVREQLAKRAEMLLGFG
jgi:collagen type I alpha